MQLERVIFCNFGAKDVKAYRQLAVRSSAALSWIRHSEKLIRTRSQYIFRRRMRKTQKLVESLLKRMQ